jgi:hypothetical protein
VLLPDPVVHLQILMRSFGDVVSLLKHLQVNLRLDHTLESDCGLPDLFIQLRVQSGLFNKSLHSLTSLWFLRRDLIL